ECPFQLPDVLHICPDVIVPFSIEIIKGKNFMSSVLQFIDKICPDKSCTTSNQYSIGFYSNSSL
ncbi:MAG: hypothetical protein P1P80_10345, partial [ANME-2 cluster archaeon]|nr:hypothetical protein [ANME-2 cluster archaeon]